MKREDRFITESGTEYKTQEDAVRGLRKAYGEGLSKLARELVPCDGKFSCMIEWLDANLERLVLLQRLKDDEKLEEELPE